MKVLILNSGLGHRMGVLTSEHPKCMTEISNNETILSRQLRLIAEAGITDVVITTGYYDDVLVKYCRHLDLPLHIEFVKNPEYDKTNYIYSIYCAKHLLDDDIILMHGDLEISTKNMARILGVKSVKPCEPAVADKHSGYQVGGTSPFGTKRRMRVFVESTILDEPFIYINAGHRGLLVKINPKDISKAFPIEPVQVGVKE